MVRRPRQGARHRPRRDARLADERAASGREPRYLQRLDDHLLHQRGNPAERDRQPRQRHAAPSLRLHAEDAQSARSVVLRQGGDAKTVARPKWVKRERSARRPIDFRLDAAEPGKIVDLSEGRVSGRPDDGPGDTCGKTGRAARKARAAGFRVELVRDWRQAAACWNDINPSTPFQHPQWCAAWYGAFAGADGVEPLIAVVTDAASGEPAALLPLIRRRQNGMRVVEFADLDLTDYNAPILGRCGAARCPRCAGAVARFAHGLAQNAWRRRSDPSPQGPGRTRWPAQSTGAARRCRAVRGQRQYRSRPAMITMAGASRWKKLCARNWRSWRVFTRDPAAGFSLVTDLIRRCEFSRPPSCSRARGCRASASIHPQRRNLCGVLSQSGRRWRRQRLRGGLRRSRSATKSWRRCSASAAARVTS